MADHQCRKLSHPGKLNPLEYIGRAWSADYHCWSLVEEVYAQAGIVIPRIQIDAQSLRAVLVALRDPVNYSPWRLIETGSVKKGDVVLMGNRQHQETPVHVGVSLGHPVVLHNLQGVGVVVSNPRNLAAQGLEILNYWRHQDA